MNKKYVTTAAFESDESISCWGVDFEKFLRQADRKLTFYFCFCLLRIFVFVSYMCLHLVFFSLFFHPFLLSIWLSHWRHTMVDGAEFWISCKRPAFLCSFSRLQVIQNSVPSTIVWRQCDVQILMLFQTWKWTFRDVEDKPEKISPANS